MPPLDIHYLYEQGETHMGVIQNAVDTFILVVGITPPTQQGRRAATIFIASGLIGTIAGVAALFSVMAIQLFAR